MFLNRLIAFLKSLFARKSVDEKLSIEKMTLPPFVASQVILTDRLRVAKFLLVFVAMVAVSGWSSAAYFYGKKETILVPALPDVLRLRSGVLPDEVVFGFSEHIASLLGTFSYRTVEKQYKELADFMAPEIRYKFLSQLEKDLPLLSELRVDEIFELDPVRKYELKTDHKGGKYTVEVRGLTRKYVEGNLRQTTPEIFFFEFRPTPITKNRPWLLQIENFRRSTLNEEEQNKLLQSISK